MLSYNPGRTSAANGLLKFDSIKTTEKLTDSNGMDLSNVTVHWNDLTNDNWLEQFTSVLNASLISAQSVGKPGNGQKINGIQTDEYAISLNPNTLPVAAFSVNVQGTPVSCEAVSATSVGESYIYENDPTTLGKFNILYRNDNNGNGSNNTGFFVYFKQGSLSSTRFSVTNAIPNNYVSIATNNITNGCNLDSTDSVSQLLNQTQVSKSLFPLQNLLKTQVREIARDIALPNAAKKDSTGICFIGKKDFREFIQMVKLIVFCKKTEKNRIFNKMDQNVILKNELYNSLNHYIKY
jgi:hypothetical protein